MNATIEPPAAEWTPVRRRTWAWILPLVALALAVWMLVQVRAESGLSVTVRASDGFGIGAGDPVRFRGIDVGVVEGVRLSTGLDEVVLDVRLATFASGLAREGTRFWVARPHVALESVVGLETLFGARYLSVKAGPPGGAPERTFLALDEPPLEERVEADGLELVLEAPSRFGLAPGAPVLHRGVDVGSVRDVRLAGDGARVEVLAYVRPEYTGLVRSNSRFWEVGGAEFTVGLTEGFRLDVQSLRGLLVGGIAFATPDEAGDGVTDGSRFALEEGAPSGVANWSPALGIGRDLERSESTLRPSPIGVRLRFTEGRLLKRDRDLTGWAVVVDGFLIGPESLLVPPEEAREGTLVWSLGDEEQPLPGPPSRRRGDLVALELPANGAWPETRLPLRRPGDPEACVVIGREGVPPIALDASRLAVAGERWRVDEELTISADWSGAPVTAQSDGALLGLLVVTEDDVQVAPLP